jgi:FMN reductase
VSSSSPFTDRNPRESPRLVVVVGNPRSRSRTAALAIELATAIAPVVHSADPEIIDLADLTDELGPPLGAGSAERWSGPLSTLHAADLLIVATPVYKGSYTGLLKSFLDHVGGGALRGITAVPVTSVGSPAHALAADVHLRPLLVELGASTPTAALVVSGELLETPAAAIEPWLQDNLQVVRRALTPALDREALDVQAS